ncbi:hypothetical protein V6N13_013529 [Hibiscus sabdariffa]
MKVLTLTSEIQKIEEVVELEVGDILFEVRIMELRFSDVSVFQKPSVNKKDQESSTKSQSRHRRIHGGLRYPKVIRYKKH